MKNNNGKMQVSLLALAVQGALLCMTAAYADDDEVAALKNPTNTLEIGATNVSRASAKFGEYSGMNKTGVYLNGGLSVKGGDTYGDGNGVRRWSVMGSDLGLTSRAAGATVSDQGKWSLGVGYDELRHNLWDTYQTPYVGAMGGNSFTLPAGFPVSTTTAAVPATLPVGTDRAAWLASYNAAAHPVDINTTRKNTSVNAGYMIDERWSVKFDYNHLEQSGAKLAAFGSMLGAGGITGEAISILPNPTNYKTDSINLALNWMGDQAHVSTSYFGSFFKEGYDRVTFQTFAGASANQIMSTAPSNDFHQLNVSGGYTFSPQTKLTGGLSYGRNTQNDPFVADPFSMIAGGLPQASLNGLVNTYHADLKLSNQTAKDLVLSASMKYDKRDDKTASQFYRFNALDGSAAHIANFANTPYSNSKTQLELAGDYRMAKDQHLKLAYNREEIKRWCDQYAIGGLGNYALLPAPYTSAAAGINAYPAGTNCVVAIASHDDKLSAAYKIKVNDNLDMNAAYSYSDRVTISDPNAITARLGLNGNINPALAANTLIQGQNGGDYRGFYPFFDASRKQQMVKAGVNWQPSEKWTIGAGGKYTDDKYPSTYGVTKGNTWSMNLDTTYAYSEQSTVSAYLTQQHRERNLFDLQRAPTLAAAAGTATAVAIPSGATWTDRQVDDDTTFGIGMKRNGLMDSKLELAGDLSYTYGKTAYGTQLNYATTTALVGGVVYTCASPQIFTCGQLPDIQNRVIQIKLTGKYKVSKQSKVMFGYVYQQMKSNDYYYNGLQAGYTPSALMPTNQQAPNYTVNAVSLAYVHDF